MIKKFNEDWNTHRDFTNDQEDQDVAKDKQHWKEHWNKMTRDINFEMDTIAEYAKEHSISYEDAQRYFKKLKEKPAKEPVKFENAKEIVVGTPSGQIIYMNSKQIIYFRERGVIAWKGVWKKPTSGGFNAIKLESYMFEDKFYKSIVEMMDTIVW